MTEVVGLSPVIDKDFPYFLFHSLFLTCKQTCKVEFTGFMIKSCLIKKHCHKTSVLLHALKSNAFKDLFGIAKPKHIQKT